MKNTDPRKIRKRNRKDIRKQKLTGPIKTLHLLPESLFRLHNIPQTENDTNW